MGSRQSDIQLKNQRRLHLGEVFFVAAFRYSQDNSFFQQSVNTEILCILFEQPSLDLADQFLESVLLVAVKTYPCLCLSAVIVVGQRKANVPHVAPPLNEVAFKYY